MSKFTFAIGAIFKNESLYLREWIEFHRLIGAEHFYLYDNGSTDNYLEVLGPYIKEGLVTLKVWPDTDEGVPHDAKWRWVHSTQVPVYEDCIRHADTKWLALIDIDEFIVPKRDKTILPLLERYEDFPAIRLYWHTYGTSNLIDIPKDKLFIESFHLTCDDQDNFNTKFHKIIMKPEQYEKFHWPPHIAMFKNEEYDIVVNKFEAQINHYMNRTVRFFHEVKWKWKEKAVNEGPFEQSFIDYYANLGNQVEDTEQAIFRYVPELRKKLGFLD